MAKRGFMSLIRAVGSLFEIDVLDIDYQYASEKLKLLSYIDPSALPRPGFFIRFASFFRQLLRSLYLYLRQRNGLKAKPITDSVLFVVTSKNQLDSARPIRQNVSASCLGGHFVPVDIQFPMWKAYLVSLPFFPLAVLRYFSCSAYQKSTFRFAFDEYWLIYGYYLVGKFWLAQLNPKSVVFANDHNYPSRALKQASSSLKIPTIYIQHASVGSKFPPLSFDYALLEGIDALEKYAEAGGHTNTIVFLIGMAKADPFVAHTNRSTIVRNIGICTNNIDDIGMVRQVCRRLCSCYPEVRFIMRPHATADGRRLSAWMHLAEAFDISFSDSRDELSFDFLKTVDAIICGDSNILLEATLMNVYPLYYDFTGLHLDLYGFHKNGLVECFEGADQMILRLEELQRVKPYIRHKAKRYCHTIGTPYDGRSGELAADIIRSINAGDQEIVNKWQRISDIDIEAYELVH